LPTQLDEGFDIPTQIPQRVALELERGLGLVRVLELAPGRVPGLEPVRVLGLGLVRVLELAPVPVLEQHRQQPS